MKNASAIERCLYEMPPHLGTLREQARTELAALQKYSHLTVCSYCGKISDAGTSDLEAKAKVALDHILHCEKRPEIQLIDAGIELEKKLAGYTETMDCGHRKADWVEDFVQDDERGGVAVRVKGYCRACREIEQAVAGAYEAAAQFFDGLPCVCDICEGVGGDVHRIDCARHSAFVIRSLDSSAAARGKQSIQKSQEEFVAQHIKGGALDGCMCEPCISVREIGESGNAWLAERLDGKEGPEYVTVSNNGMFELTKMFEFTKDPHKAIRFKRMEDALQMAGIFEFGDVRACEHSWPAIDKPGGR